KRRPRTDAGATTTDFEQGGDLLGKNSFAGHARVPLRIVQTVSPEMPDPAKHLFFPLGKMLLQPMLEQWRYCPGQPNNRVTGKLRACFCTCAEDVRNLMIG